MMSKTQQAIGQELTSIRNNINILRSQIQGGRVDGHFLVQQLDSLAFFLDRLELERQHRSQESRTNALYQVSRLIGSSLDLQTVLDQVMDAIIQLTGAERGFLMMADDDGGLQVKAARNLDQTTLTSDAFMFSRTITNQVLNTGEPIVTVNAAEDPRFAQNASIVGQALRSIMATPLRARGDVIGVVYVDSKAMTGLFNENDLAALEAFAGQAAIALDNARLFSATDHALSRRIEELTQLRRIDLLLNETLSPERAMLITLEWACRLADADSGHLGLIEGYPPRVRSVLHYGEADAFTDLSYLDEGTHDVMVVAETGKTSLIRYRGADGSKHNLMIVPVLRETHAIGVVVLISHGSNPFNGERQDLVERVIARASVSIENARLYAVVQAADRAKSEFVGIVAHDLKVPMASILGHADLLILFGEVNERQQKSITTIKDTVRRMEMLVSDLADISRIESGQFFMHTRQVALDEVLEALKEVVMPEIIARGHQFVANITPDLPILETDFYRLLQILTNLVSNAYKYTPNGGTITLSIWSEHDQVYFSVSDTGIGMPPEDLEKLGTKFWRAEDEYTRSQPGTGLGFSITRSLVEQMGGYVTVESQVGIGSTFRFDIPIAASQ